MSDPTPPKVPGFEPLLVLRPRLHHRPVLISGTGQASRYQPSLRVVINPQHFDDDAPPAWLAPGKRVWALQGVGEFSGTLRLMPNGTHELRRSTRGDGCMLSIPPLRGQPKEGFAAIAPEFDFSDGWFDIMLPPWQPKPLAAVAAVPARPAPFTLAPGVSSHPGWNSPKGAAEHAAALKGGAA